MRPDRGIALLNALIMVAAISAVAASLMLRGEISRERLGGLQRAEQAQLYLDAAELLIAPVLEADWKRDQNIDHLKEGWALERFDAEVDQGTISGALTDLQARFNINSLSDAGDLGALRSFERLLSLLDLPVPLAREVAGFVQRQGPADAERYATRDLPIRPAKAPIAAIEQLRLVQGMTPAFYDKLKPYVSALPGSTPINVNTAPLLVLAAVFPTASLDGLNQLLVYRAGNPFPSASDFMDRAEKMIHSRVIAQGTVPAGGLSSGSSWFEARFVARLDEASRGRRIVVERSRLNGAVETRHRTAEPL